jgi:molecular chaperone HtpG
MAKKEGKISISTQNLLPIIKKWLYSEHDIFLRELVSNASDAISKLKHLTLLGEYKGLEPHYQITISINKENKTLTISDNGLGLDEQEIEKYISQVAFSGAREFIEKYEKVGENKDLIGFFGLGFYSAFMVAHMVEIHSLSYKENAAAVYWKSDGNETFETDSSDKKEIGTDIILHLNEESLEFLNEETVKTTIKKYSQFLSIPIKVGENLIEPQVALWRKNASEVSDEEYDKLFHTLFPTKMTEPIFHFHIKTDYPFELNGIFYFPKINNQMDPNQGNIKFFVKDVFVGEGLKEIIPEYLAPLLGVMESPDIPLNVSRSQLQGDVRIRKIASYIETKFAETLVQLFKENRQKLEEIWPNISIFIKFGCMREDSFYNKIKDILLFETTASEFMTLKEYQEKYPTLPKKDNKTILFYAEKTRSLSAYKDILEENQIAALLIDSGFDSHFLSFLENKEGSIQFTRIDSEQNELLYKDKTLSKEQEDKIIETFKDLLNTPELLVQTNAIKNNKVPAVIIINEQMRRFEEMSMMFQQTGINPLNLSGKTLVLNTENALVNKVLELQDKDKAKALATQILDLALLDAGIMSEERKKEFIQRSTQMLDQSLS